MKEKQSSNFIVGLIFGTLAAAALWYWQKSTAADEGALKLLDRLANAEGRIRDLRSEMADKVAQSPIATVPAGDAVVTAVAPPPPARSEDLKTVHGVGPVYERRLNAAGINTVSQLAALDEARAAEILQVSQKRAANILAEARR